MEVFLNYITTHTEGTIHVITLNRPEKHNAFNSDFLKILQQAILSADHNPSIRVLILNAHGKHFCAGADLAWMQTIIHANEQDNLKDAMVLADTLFTLYHCSKPTICAVQGKAIGGGSGLVAACDFAVAAADAQFCFSEVTLGLIPAVISPYVTAAIGARNTNQLFMTAKTITADQANHIGLTCLTTPTETLMEETFALAQQIANNAPKAVQESKQLVRFVHQKCIDDKLKEITAERIAAKRISAEAQKGLKAFLDKQPLTWD